MPGVDQVGMSTQLSKHRVAKLPAIRQVRPGIAKMIADGHVERPVRDPDEKHSD